MIALLLLSLATADDNPIGDAKDELTCMKVYLADKVAQQEAADCACDTDEQKATCIKCWEQPSLEVYKEKGCKSLLPKPPESPQTSVSSNDKE